MSIKTNGPLSWQPPGVPEEVKEITIIEAITSLRAILAGERADVRCVPSEIAGMLFIAIPVDPNDHNVIFLGAGHVTEALQLEAMLLFEMVLDAGPPPQP